jgi:hypothetical protein
MNKSENAIINRLLARAKTHVKNQLEKTGCVPPVLFMNTDEGEIQIAPHQLDDQADLERFILIAKMLCRAHDTRAIAMVAEVTVISDNPGTVPAGKSKFCRECVMISVETSKGLMIHALLPIFRSAAGKYSGLGLPERLHQSRVTGRCSDLLPRKKPTARIRRIMRSALQPHLGRFTQSAPKLPRGVHSAAPN